MERHLIKLEDWMIIKISGSQIEEYLNGIITLELHSLKSGEIKRSAFLTPKGKIRSLYWVKKNDNGLLIYCPAEMKTQLVEDLLKYKLTMDVKIEDITAEVPQLYLISDESSSVPGLSTDSIGYRFLNLNTNDQKQIDDITKELGTTDYQIFTVDQLNKILISNGLIPPALTQDHNPFELGLYDMIYLDKGCFLGQEPLSRMFHRGNPRKFLYQIRSLSPFDIGAITSGEEEVGEILVKTEKDGVYYGLSYINRQIKDFSEILYQNYPIEVIGMIGQYPNIWQP